MQNKLDQNQIGTLREKFRDHPLLVTCCKAFGCYEADMQFLLFAPEELFQEAAIIIDEILRAPEEAEAYIDGLWNSLKIKIRRWENGIPQDELNQIIGAVFYVVATVFLQHWHGFFRKIIKDKLLIIAQKKMGISSDEEHRVILELAYCAEGLREWLIEYSESDKWLTDEIEETLTPEQEMFLPIDTKISVFNDRLNEVAIIKAIKELNRGKMGEVNFAYAVHTFFESIDWLSSTIDTKFVLWMKAHKLMNVLAKDLKQAKPEDSRVKGLISDMKSVFQEKHPKTDNWRDKKEFYYPNKKLINTGE